MFDTEKTVSIGGLSWRIASAPYGARERIEARRQDAQRLIEPARARVRAARPDLVATARLDAQEPDEAALAARAEMGRLVGADPEFLAHWPAAREILAECDLELAAWSVRAVDGQDLATEQADCAGRRCAVVPRVLLDRIAASALWPGLLGAVQSANALTEDEVLGFLRPSGGRAGP